MQATVRTFDAASRSGSVLLDDGVEIAYGADAFDAGGLRLVRPGQRVRIELDDPDVAVARVTVLTLHTFPDPA